MPRPFAEGPSGSYRVPVEVNWCVSGDKGAEDDRVPERIIRRHVEGAYPVKAIEFQWLERRFLTQVPHGGLDSRFAGLDVAGKGVPGSGHVAIRSAAEQQEFVLSRARANDSSTRLDRNGGSLPASHNRELNLHGSCNRTKLYQRAGTPAEPSATDKVKGRSQSV